MKQIVIGIFGAWIDSDNMGCAALGYSLIELIDVIARNNDIHCKIVIFENTNTYDGFNLVNKKLELESELELYCEGQFGNCLSALKHWRENLRVIKKVEQCNLVIDITGGDSFTDIYGQRRYNQLTTIKRIVQKKRIPLVLGPQTYGPFEKHGNMKLAKKVIENATLVMSRDQLSVDYINSFCNKKINVTTDLAFRLLCSKQKNNISDKIRVGINVSGLLVSQKNESTIVKTKIKADYDAIMVEVIDYLLSNPQYEIYFVPHVGDDGLSFIKKHYPDISAVNYISQFDNPVSAKECISSMDIFIGARMHANIAAFSTEVATIPIAYSRKFSGVFDSLNYPYTVDLTKLDTQQAVERTKDLINSYKDLENVIIQNKNLIQNKNENNYLLFEKIIQKFAHDEQ